MLLSCGLFLQEASLTEDRGFLAMKQLQLMSLKSPEKGVSEILKVTAIFKFLLFCSLHAYSSVYNALR